MNKKFVFLLIPCALLAMAYVYLQPDKSPVEVSVDEFMQTQSAQTMDKVEDEEVNDSADEDLALRAMKEKYALLNTARKELKLSLSRTESRLRKVKFAPEKAVEIGKLMQKANYSLKNPRLLGAFSDITEIERELETAQSYQDRLGEIRALVKSMREQKNPAKNL